MASAELHSATAMRLDGIEGRVALVTGAAGGIGERVAETLSALGARVVGADLRRVDAPVALGIELDVTDEGAVDACFDEVERELGPVELLVTSAGIFSSVRLDALDAEMRRHTLDVNLTGTFLVARRAAGPMQALGRGRMVTISSAAGIDGGAEACSDYAASKGGVIALTKALSKELVRAGITANVVAPRAVGTPMIAGLEDELKAVIPAGRLGTPDDVAAAVAFLCSSHASYMTGEVLCMNGGWW